MPDWLNGTIAGKTQWNDTHYSLAIEVEGPVFTAGQFVRVAMNIGEEVVGRPYSLVNAPHQRLFEIFFNIVPEGPLTSRLAELDVGDEILMTDTANGLLTLPQVPDTARDLWLLATGTGIGPFLSILRTDEPWSRFDRIVLGYSVRHRDNLAYMDLIREFEALHPDRFRFVPLVTGEDVEGALGCRIPEALTNGQLENQAQVALSPEHSHVMLCGHAGMIGDVVNLLEQRGMRRHKRREPGHISTEKYH